MTHYHRKHRRRASRGGKVRNFILISAGVVFAAVCIGLIAVVGYVISIAATTPNIDELKPFNKGSTSSVFASDGRLLGYVRSDIVRQPILESEIPQDVRSATVAIEDARFYKHHGVDFEGIVRAAVKNIENHKTVQGGSTITMQLVRALYMKDPRRDLKRKIREAKLASELEDERPKHWILTEYLNEIPYGTVNGETAVGIEAASEIFFSKHAKDLTLDEAALLAGLPQAPSDYNPFKNPGAAVARRNEVLRAMVKNHYISQQQAVTAAAKPLKLHPGDKYFTRHEPYFFDYVSELLIQKYGINAYRKGGLKVYTTIDPNLQQTARQAIAGQLNQPGDPSSAIVAVDPRNGYIRAMASSGSYKSRNFNLAAQAHRQPGSAFKTFVLTTAIKQGVNPDATSYDSKPLALPLGYGQVWKVKTYDNTYLGRTTITNATLHSDNTVYAQLDMDVGPQNVAETAKSMGITTPLNGYPAEGLGGLHIGVSPLEMADAYATLADGGVHHKPIAITKVEFPDGKSDDWGKVQGDRVLTDGQADAVTKILHMNVLSGTGVRANYGCPAAGKTGTTDNFTDAWFVGYQPHLAAAVWVGYPNSTQIQMRNVHGIEVQGGSFPAMIWHDFMNVARNGFCGDFPPPTTPVTWTPFFGKYARSSAPTDTTNPYSVTNTTTTPTKKPKTNGGAQPPGQQKKDKKKGYDPRLYETPPQGPPPGGVNGNGNTGTTQQPTSGGGAAPPPAGTGTGTVQSQG